jgi:hypothetical protein
MYMVGGENARIYRGCKPRKNTRRWMTPSRPVKIRQPFDWAKVGDAAMAICSFGALIFALQVIALYFQ